MSRIIFFLLICLPAYGEACEYGNDPRLEDDPIALIKAIRSGQEKGQIRMTLPTYLGMGRKSQKIFGEYAQITSLDCKPIGVLDGEVIGVASMEFEEFYRAMARAIRKNQPNVAKKLISHGKVSPISISQYLELFGRLPYKKTGGLNIRQKMEKIFPAVNRLPPQPSWLKDQAKQGRMADYAMARLWSVFGGQLKMDRQCGPYEIPEKFYTVVQVRGLLGGVHNRYVTRQDAVVIMLKIMGLEITFTDKINFTINSCRG